MLPLTPTTKVRQGLEEGMEACLDAIEDANKSLADAAEYILNSILDRSAKMTDARTDELRLLNRLYAILGNAKRAVEDRVAELNNSTTD